MTSFADVADVEARIGREITDEPDLVRVQALLNDATAAVKAYTGRQFGEGTVTRRFRPHNGEIRLRSGVVDVIDVRTVGGANAIAFLYDGLDRVTISLPDRFDLEPIAAGTAVEVTYAYDAGPVPDVIRAVTAQMAARAYGVRAMDSGKTQESIAGYSYSVGPVAASGGIGMLDPEIKMLNRFRRVGGTAWVTMR